MSYIGSDIEQDNKPANLADFHRQRSSSNLINKAVESPKMQQQKQWNENQQNEDTDSELSDSGNFLAKGAFLLTPSHELTMDRAAMICEKMNFKGCFSLTKTATGILFKFSDPSDYQAVFKKGFHKVTGARFYKKVGIPCRPQKTFTLFVCDVPEEVPEQDIRHSLYKFNSVVEVVRLLVVFKNQPQDQNATGTMTPKLERKAITPKVVDEADMANKTETPPSPIRITLASLEEYNYLLQNGLDFYGATYFPTDSGLQTNARIKSIATKKGTRLVDGSIPGRVRELLPVFDSHGFSKIAHPVSKTYHPIQPTRTIRK